METECRPVCEADRWNISQYVRLTECRPVCEADRWNVDRCVRLTDGIVIDRCVRMTDGMLPVREADRRNVVGA